MSEARRDPEDQDQEQTSSTEGTVARGRGLLGSVVNGLLWPFSVVVRAYRGFWQVLGFRQPRVRVPVSPAVLGSARRSLTGRKRLHRFTRLLLSVVPHWVQRALGYPVSSSIGRSLSPEIRASPTKPSGKGSKRKQDDLDDEEEEEEGQHRSWVVALTQEFADDEGSDKDPDYEPSTVETETEEYCSHNDTESEIEDQGSGVVIITDVSTDVIPSTGAQVSCPAD